MLGEVGIIITLPNTRVPRRGAYTLTAGRGGVAACAWLEPYGGQRSYLPLTYSGGPRRAGQQLFTKELCPTTFLMRAPVCVSHAATVLSADAEKMVWSSVDQCTSSTAFL